MQKRRGTARSNSEKKCYLKGCHIIKILLSIYCIIFLYFVRKVNISGQLHSQVIADPESDSKTEETIGISESINRIDIKRSKGTIAYAVSLTKCPEGEGLEAYVDGASVLRHSIHLNSFETFESSGSLYGYKLIAFVHPEAEKCSSPLGDLGFEVMIKETPIDVKEIRGKFLREHVWKTGCCGEKEFLKLYAYTLIDYPVVVHLDMDALILKPFDDLFDAMIEGNDEQKEKVETMFKNVTIPQRIDAYFTNDYNMLNRNNKHPGIQGGFLIVRTNMTVYNEYRETILEGAYFQGSGWGRLGYGGYYGAQQIQGLVSYFYGHLHPGTALELNRCIYNNMIDNPLKNYGKGEVCITREKTCEDCRMRKLEEIKSIHFTICPKPWTCAKYLIWGAKSDARKQLCRQFHREWFRVRRDFEDNYLPRLKKDWKSKRTEISSNFYPDHFFGFCKEGGDSNYISIN